MAQETPNRIVEWYQALREWLPDAKARTRDWAREARQRPALIWETPALRYSLLVVGGLLVLMIVKVGAAKLAPSPPADAVPVATEAYFHVLCSEPTCGNHFMIYRKKGFSGFPVECPKCHRKSGYLARQCFSPTCKGRWVIGIQQDGRWVCPTCHQPL